MNKVFLMGRLTRDPELRQTQNGVSSCRFSVAVNRKFKNDNGEYDADFISCTAWKQTAEFITRYFHKGSMICIEGTLRTGSYPDKNHPDVTHYTTDVWVDNVEFTSSKSESGQGGYNNNQNAYSNANAYGNANPYGGNNNYQAPPVQQAPDQQPAAPNNDSMSYGKTGEFEEILSDQDVPF